MSDLIQTGFDYSALPYDVALKAQLAANSIKLRLKRTVEDIIEIGRELTAVKAELPHGQFLPWIADNGMTLFNASMLNGKQYPCEILAYNDILEIGHAVYCLSDPRSGHVIYVGKTTNLPKRAKQHCIVSVHKNKSWSLDKRKIDIFQSGLPVVLSPVFRCKDAFESDAIEQLVFEINKSTALNIQRNKWRIEAKY